MIQAVIFDMDGLMIDSEPIQSLSFETVIREYGKVPELHANGLVHETGVRGDKNWQAMKEKYNLPDEISVLRLKRRAVYEQILHKVKAMPGLYELIETLQNNNISTAIVTSSPRKHAEPILKQLNIIDYFNYIICGDEVEKGKPDPEGFAKASKMLAIEPEYCLVLEDAESGIIAAKAISMKAIAVPSPYTKHHNMKKADKIVGSLYDIKIDTIQSL